MRKALSPLILGVSVLFAIIAVHAEQIPWYSFYHSINRIGAQLRRSSIAYTGATPAHHNSKKKYHSSPSPKKPTDQTKESATPTPEPSVDQGSKKNSSDSQENNPKKEDAEKVTPPSVASLQPADLREFNSQSPKMQDLIRSALALTERNLGYTYGSSDPNSGGMDCSGFIYYVLTNAGFKDVPRQSSDQYLWVRKNSVFHAVLSRNSDTFELKQLRPGDLMFWSGTYQINRDVPITHVMIYLGTEKKTKKPVMVGASDGRSYNGERRFGVSVFDFKLPNGAPNKTDPDLIARFEGYASIPGLAESEASVDNQSSASPTPTPHHPKLVEKKKPLSNGD
jgi:peptidoglycan DL-endopeptidase CwlO